MTVLIVICAVVILGIIAVGFYAEAPGLGFGVAFCAAVILALPVLTYAHSHYNERTLECTVTDKDRGGDEGSYRIYTDQCGQLANTDSMWRGKWNSADLWQQIKPGETYRLTIVGWRAEFFSTFPNVLKVEPVR